jgi:hypothetical protein
MMFYPRQGDITTMVLMASGKGELVGQFDISSAAFSLLAQ